jgi:methyltransferase-like protein
MAAYGSIYGLSPTDPDKCRVLEIGCGDGGNLIPMACDFPESTYLGLDLSPVQIAIGQKLIDSLGLDNIRLEARSILDCGSGDGRFDYIICHGVYSWVPDRVKEKILEVCKKNLAAQGIAYISYNVLPGWQFNQCIREMLLYRTRGIENPRKRTEAALDLLEAVTVANAESKRVHAVQFRFFEKNLKSFPDVHSYLLHDYMAANNDPFYFNEFANAVHAHGLQYICDADQADFELDAISPKAAEKIEALAENRLATEQYIDFFNNTVFRRSLVCHDGIALDSDYQLGRIEHLFAATDVMPILDMPESTVEDARAFKTLNGRRFSTEHPLAQAVLRELSSLKPCSITIDELVDAVRQAAPPPMDEDTKALTEKVGHVLYALFFNGVVELLAAGRRGTAAISDNPCASPIARQMAPSQRVTNLCHRTIVIDDEMACFVLSHLDGTRNQEALLDFMQEGVRSGRVRRGIQNDNASADDRESMRRQLASILKNFFRSGLLIA